MCKNGYSHFMVSRSRPRRGLWSLNKQLSKSEPKSTNLRRTRTANLALCCSFWHCLLYYILKKFCRIGQANNWSMFSWTHSDSPFKLLLSVSIVRADFTTMKCEAPQSIIPSSPSQHLPHLRFSNQLEELYCTTVWIFFLLPFV